jgi:hypothetical protein
MRRRQELPEDWVFRLDGFLSFFFVFVFCFFVADADVIVVFSSRDDGGTSRRDHLGGVRGHFLFCFCLMARIRQVTQKSEISMLPHFSDRKKL